MAIEQSSILGAERADDAAHGQLSINDVIEQKSIPSIANEKQVASTSSDVTQKATDTPPAPAPVPAPEPAPDQPAPTPLPPVTDAPWNYIDFGKTYVGDNIKISFDQKGNNIVASGEMTYSGVGTFPFFVATDNFGTSRGSLRVSWNDTNSNSLSCPVPIEINYVDKDLINVYKPDQLWSSTDYVGCPQNAEFEGWKLVPLKEYVPPPPPPPKPPKPEPQPKPDPKPKKSKH